jgi:hypothetical protein
MGPASKCYCLWFYQRDVSVGGICLDGSLVIDSPATGSLRGARSRNRQYTSMVDWKTWRRPTLPCLEAQYHGRWGFSRPSSGWDRVRAPRHGHQVVQSTPGANPCHFGARHWGLSRRWRFWCDLCAVLAPPGACRRRSLGMISMHGACPGFDPGIRISSRSGD